MKSACLLKLSEPTEILLTRGSDDRSIIDTTFYVNKYLSSTVPNPELIQRSSCTSSSIDFASYALANKLKQELQAEVRSSESNADIDAILTKYFLVAHTRLKKFLSLSNPEDEVVLFPSGSDAEFFPLILAMIRSYNLSIQIDSKNPGFEKPRPKVFSIITCACEVGSGSPKAAEGKHFSKLSPRGHKQNIDEELDGIAVNSIEVMYCNARKSDGTVNSDVDKLYQQIQSTLSSVQHSVLVLHVVIGSKTGLIFPSMDLIETICHEFGNRIIVVADACQMRCHLSLLRKLTEFGFISLITGSKFFSAPPFCGAVVIPSFYVDELESHVKSVLETEFDYSCVPKGLGGYITAYDVPLNLPNLRRYLGQPTSLRNSPQLCMDQVCNLGLLLRWNCALSIMEKYKYLYEYVIQMPNGTEIRPLSLFTSQWVHGVQTEVRCHHPYLRLLPVHEGLEKSGINVEDVNTIISISVWVADNNFENGWRSLSYEECKQFHKIMSTKIEYVPNCASLNDNSIGHIKALLGQPVLISVTLSVIRLALGANMVVDALSPLLHLSNDNFPSYLHCHRIIESASCRVLIEDRAILRKMAFVAKFWIFFSNHPQKQINMAYAFDTELISRMRKFDCILNIGASNTQLHNRKEYSRIADLKSISTAVQKLIKSETDNARKIPNVFILYNLDALHNSFHALLNDFNSATELSKLGAKTAVVHTSQLSFLHCFAMKSCPVSYIIYRAIESGLGVEVASYAELIHALRCKCPPDRVVFDSPCKTVEEIQYALTAGVRVNVNSFVELERIQNVLKSVNQDVYKKISVGLRVNPVVGPGRIAALSTASDRSSKFGIPLIPNDTISRRKILDAFQTYTFLSGVMCHVGSQGVSVEAMVQGAATITDLADEIDRESLEPRIKFIDIGGGLYVNYDDDSIGVEFLTYAQQLRERCPNIFNPSSTRTIITEFGKSLVAKAAAIVMKVEDSISNVTCDSAQVICHAGADLMVRAAYCPANFHHRVALLNHEGIIISLESPTILLKTTIHGPLCFSGDVVAKDRCLPACVPGDFCVVLDAGANTYSLFSRHCSRQAPPVYAYRRFCNSSDRLESGSSYLVITCVKEEETIDQVLQFWG